MNPTVRDLLSLSVLFLATFGCNSESRISGTKQGRNSVMEPGVFAESQRSTNSAIPYDRELKSEPSSIAQQPQRTFVSHGLGNTREFNGDNLIVGGRFSVSSILPTTDENTTSSTTRPWPLPVVISWTDAIALFSSGDTRHPRGILRPASGNDKPLHLPVFNYDPESPFLQLLVPRSLIAADSRSVNASQSMDIFFLVDADGKASVICDLIFQTVRSIVKHSPDDVAFGYALVSSQRQDRQPGFELIHWINPRHDLPAFLANIHPVAGRYRNPRVFQFASLSAAVERISWRRATARAVVLLNGEDFDLESVRMGARNTGAILVAPQDSQGHESLATDESRAQLAKSIHSQIREKQTELIPVWCLRSDVTRMWWILTELEFRMLTDELDVFQKPHKSRWLSIPRDESLSVWLSKSGLPQLPGLNVSQNDVLANTPAFAGAKALANLIVKESQRASEIHLVPLLEH